MPHTVDNFDYWTGYFLLVLLSVLTVSKVVSVFGNLLRLILCLSVQDYYYYYYLFAFNKTMTAKTSDKRSKTS